MFFTNFVLCSFLGCGYKICLSMYLLNLNFSISKPIPAHAKTTPSVTLSAIFLRAFTELKKKKERKDSFCHNCSYLSQAALLPLMFPSGKLWFLHPSTWEYVMFWCPRSTATSSKAWSPALSHRLYIPVLVSGHNIVKSLMCSRD